MTVMTKLKGFATAAGFAASLMVGGATYAAAEDVTLTMAVPDWPPTRIMKKFFDEQYKPASGNTVKLDVDFIPWPDFYTRVNASLTSGEQKYNFIVSDSQWLGAFVEGGYFRKINDLLEADPAFMATFKSIHPNPLNAYSTYPHKSENYYGFPQFPDVLVNFARADIICHEEEQKNFQAKYSKKLPCTGEELDAMTWDDFKNVGEFFRRKKGDMLAGKPAEDDFYGIAYQAGKGYDFSSMQINGFIWQMGGNTWDETTAPTGQAEGVVNSPEAVAALEKYLSLLEFMPPVVKTGTMDIFVSDQLFREGKVAMNIDWIGLGRSFARSEIVEGFRQAGVRPDAGHHGRRRQDDPVVQHRRPALRADHLDDRLADQGSRGIREMVAVIGNTAPVRAGRRPIGGQVGLRRSEVCDLSSVEPRLGAAARLAEGRLACAAVLRTPDPAAGPVRPCHHRQARCQDHAG